MYNANYMDGVPVKIAEKYKPPPSIYNLSQPLANKLNLENDFYWNCPMFSYDLGLEKKAMSKIEQWKRIRQRNKEQRKERNLRREEQRKREYEDTQKNLLYSVSYPSTDDLSSGEEEEDKESKQNCISNPELKEITAQICAEATVNSFDNILQPTVLSLNSSSIAHGSQNFKIKSTLDTKISHSFNYKDFEDDTSSPFDNIELKTINDLDVLAQVLHNTQIKSPANEKFNEQLDNNSYESNKCCNSECEKITAENIPKHNNTSSRFDSFKSPQVTLPRFRDHHLVAESSIQHSSPIFHSSLTPLHIFNGLDNSNGFHNYQPNYNQSINKNSSVSPQPRDTELSLMDDQITKSKSVPDILKELKDEIRKSEVKRYRNCSSNMEHLSQHIDICLTNKSTVKPNYDIEETFSQLDSKAQQLVEEISAMGFPFKRVARIVHLLGADDKKVVEHLIPLSELADLGFEETKISDALIRNTNNKNKALDDLIS